MKSMIWNKELYDPSDFEVALYNVSDIELNFRQRVRNWKKFDSRKTPYE